MRQNEWVIPGILLCGLLQPATVFAESAAVPSWAYESLQQLVDEGYADMPTKDIRSCSREELAQLAAQALKNIDKIQQGTLADEYGRVTRLALNDEVQLKLSREQERETRNIYQSSESRAKRDTELLVRRSMQGVNRLEVMNPLKEKAKKSQGYLELAARSYAQSRARTIRWERAYTRILERQQNIYGAMTGMPTDSVVQKKTKGLLHDVPGQQAVSASSLMTGCNVSMSVAPTSLVSSEVQSRADQLRAEFLNELTTNGYTDDEAAERQLYSNAPIKDITSPRLKVDGEVRIDSGHSTSSEGIGDRTRIRARVYPDYDIDGNWHAKGMVEAEKALSGEKGNNDGKVRLDRYYLEGNVGTVKVDAGAFGSSMAEGNIYDSRFKGFRLATGTPVKYQWEFGTLDNVHRVYDLTASYDEQGGGWDGGYYHFNSINGTQRNIYMANWRHPLSNFDFGAMLLHGNDDVAGNGTGFVFTLSHGHEDSWKPRNASYWLKYYRQPSSTYVEHTMNGMADYMNYDATPYGYSYRGGFRGWGLGYNYTLRKDLVLGMQYYSLWDLNTHAHSNTIWGALTAYFKNYKE